MDEIKAFFSTPYPYLGAGFAALVGVWWSKLTPTTANLTLVFGIAGLTVGTFLLVPRLFSEQPLLVRLLWTMAGFSVISLAVYFTLWTVAPSSKGTPTPTASRRMQPGLRSFLIPANDPTPPNACDNFLNDEVLARYKVDRDSLRLAIIGTSACYYKASPELFTLIRIAGKEVLSVEPSHGGIVLNATLVDENKSLVATITKNVYKPYMTNDYEVTGDEHTILILDSKDRVILFVRYLNPTAIKVLGIFRSEDRPPVNIEESKITIGRSVFSGYCSLKTIHPSTAL